MALVEMAPVLVVGLRRDLDGVLDLFAAREDRRLMPAPPLAAAEPALRGDDHSDARTQLARLERQASELLARLTPALGDGAAVPSPGWCSAWTVAEMEAWVARLGASAEHLARVERAAAGEHRAIEGYVEAAGAMATVLEALRTVPGVELVLIVVSAAHRAAVASVARAIGQVTGHAPSVYEAAIGGGRLAVLLAWFGGAAAHLKRLLVSSGLTHMDLKAPEAGPAELVRLLSARADELGKTREAAHRSLQELARDNRAALEAVLAEARRRLRRETLRSLARETRFTFTLGAWVPAQRLASLRAEIAAAGRGTLAVPVPGGRATDPAPIIVHNPSLIAPYEVFLRLLPLAPEARTDPTPFIALSFPTFVGLMVGDVGYGAVLTALGVLLRKWGAARRRDAAVTAGRILSHCGVFSILFGALFGEAFGLSGQVRLAPLWFDRRDTPLAYLFLVMGAGAGHLLTAYVMGLRAAVRMQDWRRGARLAGELASLASLGLLVAMGVGVVAGSLRAPVLLLLAVALTLLVYAAGYVGPLEAPSALVAFISYTRLFAVGLASASLARVANQVGGLFGSAVLGVAAAVLLHVVFLATSLATPLAQAARLQLVEFGGRIGMHGPDGKPGHRRLSQRGR